MLTMAQHSVISKAPKSYTKGTVTYQLKYETVQIVRNPTKGWLFYFDCY